MNEQQVRIRKATPEDAAGIARVHVDSWRSTYRGQVPDRVLDNMSYAVREDMWATIISDPDQGNITLVAEQWPGMIIGFADGGRNRGGEKEFVGELAALYLRQEAQGQGIGRRLVYAIAQELASQGLNSMIIWVLSTNPARGFYERLGGIYVGKKPLNIGGANLTEVAYGWRDLSMFGP